jgi:UDP-N-acetyl-D-glucosamine dehydrogenase
VGPLAVMPGGWRVTDQAHVRASQFAGCTSQPISAAYDVVLIATAHDEYRRFDFREFNAPVIDTRNRVQRRPQGYHCA